MTALAPHPDRLFPADPAERDLARRLHAAVAHAPIYSPHGHVPAAMLADDEPFPDPAALLITPDHYVTRMLHAVGVPLGDLGLARDGVPSPPPAGRSGGRSASTGTSSSAPRCGSGSSRSSARCSG
ncbi:hypothetical protein [Streptomyces sp. L7]|uniref:hypothetical protein n=1 Tax=Streptomyces sp. L7 TaxID=3423954 RepID=UPI003D95F0DB